MIWNHKGGQLHKWIGSGTGAALLGCFSPLAAGNPPIPTPPVLWLDGSDVDGDGSADTETGLVETWVDKSPDGNDLAGENNQPSSAEDFNGTGMNAVVFEGNSLSREGTLGLSGAPAVTVFIVADTTGLTGDGRFLQIGDDGPSNGGRSIAFSGDSSWRFNNGNNIFASDSMSGIGPSIGIWRSEADTNYGEKEFFLNNATPAMDTDGEDTGGPTTITGGGEGFTTLGAGWYANSAHTLLNATASGSYAEVIVYDVTLSDEDLNAVGFYLQDKWQITNADFTPVAGSAPAITEISVDGDSVTLIWNSSAGETYTVNYSPDLLNWNGELDDSVLADPESDQTSLTFNISGTEFEDDSSVFFRVSRNP